MYMSFKMIETSNSTSVWN